MTTTTIALGRLVSSRIEKVYQHYAKNPDVDVDVKNIEDSDYNNTTYFDSDIPEIYSTTTILFSGRKRRPTIFLPHNLLKKYNMARPCMISITPTKSGILLKFLHATICHNK